MSDPPTKIKYKYCVIMNRYRHCLSPQWQGYILKMLIMELLEPYKYNQDR